MQESCYGNAVVRENNQHIYEAEQVEGSVVSHVGISASVFALCYTTVDTCDRSDPFIDGVRF